jgi:soluble lytic murein transglycosylase-like protein
MEPDLRLRACRLLAALGFAALAGTAGADTLRVPQCHWSAAVHHNVPPLALWGMAAVESDFRADAENRNRDGSLDLGIAQVNSVHWPRLRAYGIDPHALREPCLNLYVRAWLYREKIVRHGNTWQAVGATHSETPPLMAAYAQRVANRISRACGRSMEACRVASLTLPAEPADDPSPGSTR